MDFLVAKKNRKRLKIKQNDDFHVDPVAVIKQTAQKVAKKKPIEKGALLITRFSYAPFLDGFEQKTGWEIPAFAE